ncbi:MAG: hypothetical protein GPJ54_15685, partial [Candidatus Heimdallarchaeota archaeon]|nr:hypothetical protein [Candidatus Heimdallarchaeota archaeon]
YENVIEDNKYGIYIIGGLQDTNNIHDNILLLNGFFITESVADSSNWYFYHNIRSLDSNTVNGKPVGYFNHTSGLTISTNDYGQIILINASQTVIENQNILSGSIGIEIEHSDHVEIRNSVFQNNTEGIGIYYSSNITVSNNIIDGGTETGVNILKSSDVNITGNDISHYQEGIHSIENDNSEITNNTIHNNGNDGVSISTSTNMIINRNFVHTNGYGSTYAPTPLSGLQLNFEVESPTNLENNGLYCDQITNTDIHSNTFYNNQGYGFYGEFSCNGDLYNNDFIDNNRTEKLHPNSTNNFKIPESSSHDIISTHDTPQIYVWHNDTIIENYFSDADFEDMDGDELGDIPYELQDDQFGNLLETLSVTNPYGWHHAISKPKITKAIFLPEGGITVFWDKSEDTLQHDLVYTIALRLMKNNLEAKSPTSISVTNPEIKNIEGTIDITNIPNLFYYLEVYAEDSDGIRSESSYMTIELSEIISGTYVPVSEKTSSNTGEFTPSPTTTIDATTVSNSSISDGGVNADDQDDRSIAGFLLIESLVFFTLIISLNILFRRRVE